MSKKRYYYVTGNTSQGLINYLHTNIKHIEQIIVLNHCSYTVKTAMLQQIVDQYDDVDVLCSPFGDPYLEGVIMRGKSVAIITDRILTSEVKGFQEIHLEDFLRAQCEPGEISKIKLSVNENRQKAYANLSKALRIHDDLEKVYIQEMNFSKANEITDQFIESLLQGISKQNRVPQIYQRFFGTNTDQGPVNKLPEIIADISKRVYIKGRAGTGKSVFMKKVAKSCLDYGFDIEQYHCSFDPASIDMILVPGLDFCIFDSTAPHEFSPERDSDIVIDLYEQAVNQGTEEKYAAEIKQITQKYKTLLSEGIDDLKQARIWQDKLEESYTNIDSTEINEIIREVHKHI